MVEFKFDALYRKVFIESLRSRVSRKVNLKFVLVGGALRIESASLASQTLYLIATRGRVWSNARITLILLEFV